MRLLSAFLSLALLSSAVASPPSKEKSDEEKGPTVFNDKEVPPMLQLSSEGIDDKIAKGNWCVHLSL